MINAPKRMWINQPSTLQPLHKHHGTNVLARHEQGDTWQIFFLSGDVISMQASKLSLSEGWLPPAHAPSAGNAEIVEVVVGLHKALATMLEKHDPDSNVAEWLGHSNELVRKLTGRDVSLAPTKAFDIPAINNKKIALMHHLNLDENLESDYDKVKELTNSSAVSIFEYNTELYGVAHASLHFAADALREFNSNLWKIKKL